MDSKELHPRVVDFSAFGVDKAEMQLLREHFDQVAQQLWNGFTTDGLVYIKNHGINEAEIARAFAAADLFFELPDAVKNKYCVQKGDETKQGYVPIDGERLSYNDNLERSSSTSENTERPMEHRECFNVSTTKSGVLPEADSPGFTIAIDVFYRRCSLLALRVLRAIAIALKLEDEHYFTDIHLPMDIVGNYSLLRLINYPPLSVEDAAKSTVRCGEHSDYGSLTLLFQDDVGGLEAKTRSGQYVQITPIPGTVIANIGNILEHMTSGQLLSVKHRVHIKNDKEHTTKRRAIAFFVHPVHETLVQRLNGPVELTAENAKDFVKKHVDATYKF